MNEYLNTGLVALRARLKRLDKYSMAGVVGCVTGMIWLATFTSLVGVQLQDNIDTIDVPSSIAKWLNQAPAARIIEMEPQEILGGVSLETAALTFNGSKLDQTLDGRWVLAQRTLKEIQVLRADQKRDGDVEKVANSPWLTPSMVHSFATPELRAPGQQLYALEKHVLGHAVSPAAKRYAVEAQARDALRKNTIQLSSIALFLIFGSSLTLYFFRSRIRRRIHKIEHVFRLERRMTSEFRGWEDIADRHTTS